MKARKPDVRRPITAGPHAQLPKCRLYEDRPMYREPDRDISAVPLDQLFAR